MNRINDGTDGQRNAAVTLQITVKMLKNTNLNAIDACSIEIKDPLNFFIKLFFKNG